MITIMETWTIVDRWWTAEPEKTLYVEVVWDGSVLMFMRRLPDKVWRIVSL